MVRSVEELLKCRDINYLHLQLLMLRPNVASCEYDKKLILSVMNGNGEEELKRVDAELVDLKQSAENILIAIQWLTQLKNT